LSITLGLNGGSPFVAAISLDSPKTEALREILGFLPQRPPHRVLACGSVLRKLALSSTGVAARRKRNAVDFEFESVDEWLGISGLRRRDVHRQLRRSCLDGESKSARTYDNLGRDGRSGV
jgi:hypothetical protein